MHCHRGSAERDCQASLLNLIEFVSFSQNMIGFNGFNNCEPRFRGGGGDKTGFCGMNDKRSSIGV